MRLVFSPGAGRFLLSLASSSLSSRSNASRQAPPGRGGSFHRDSQPPLTSLGSRRAVFSEQMQPRQRRELGTKTKNRKLQKRAFAPPRVRAVAGARPSATDASPKLHASFRDLHAPHPCGFRRHRAAARPPGGRVVCGILPPRDCRLTAATRDRGRPSWPPAPAYLRSRPGRGRIHAAPRPCRSERQLRRLPGQVPPTCLLSGVPASPGPCGQPSRLPLLGRVVASDPATTRRLRRLDPGQSSQTGGLFFLSDRGRLLSECFGSEDSAEAGAAADRLASSSLSGSWRRTHATPAKRELRTKTKNPNQITQNNRIHAARQPRSARPTLVPPRTHSAGPRSCPAASFPRPSRSPDFRRRRSCRAHPLAGHNAPRSITRRAKPGFAGPLAAERPAPAAAAPARCSRPAEIPHRP